MIFLVKWQTMFLNYHFRTSEKEFVWNLLHMQGSVWSCDVPAHKIRKLGTEGAVTGPCICDDCDVGHNGTKNLKILRIIWLADTYCLRMVDAFCSFLTARNVDFWMTQMPSRLIPTGEIPRMCSKWKIWWNIAKVWVYQKVQCRIFWM